MDIYYTMFTEQSEKKNDRHYDTPISSTMAAKNSDAEMETMGVEYALDLFHGGAFGADLPTFVGGGEINLINEGTYGCIYHPGINCQGRKENVNYLTKIMKSTKTIQNEIAIAAYIKSISGYTRFFAPILKQCPVKISKKFVGEVKQCELFKGETDAAVQSKTYYSNKIRYVGDTNISKHILSQYSLPIFWKELLETHTHLLKGVQKLLTRDIIHHDVKYNNIMYDAKMGNPVFIDFGISIHVSSLNVVNLRDAFYVFDTYPYWCLEVCINNYIFREITATKAQSAKITRAELETIIDVFVYGYDKKYDGGTPAISNGIFTSRVLPLNNSQLVSQFKKRAEQFYSRFVGKTWYSLYLYFMENKLYHKWDGYSLAAVYLFILDDLMKQSPQVFQTVVSKTPTQYKRYCELLSSILFSMPDERPSPQQTVKTIKQIMKSLSAIL